MKSSRSIGVFLDLVIGPNEKKIFEQLKQCSRQVAKQHFKVLFFHSGLKETQIKSFIQRNSDDVFYINVDITKDFNRRVFYMIEPESSKIVIWNFRYKFMGNIIPGLVEYKKLINHVSKREREYHR